MPLIWSPIATRIAHPRDVKDREKPYGILVHTTGSGIVLTAQKKGADPLEYAVSFYSTPNNNFAHYIIGWGGEIIQIASDTEKAWQAAWTKDEKEPYKTDSWRNLWIKPGETKITRVNAAFYSKWVSRWPEYKGPVDLLNASCEGKVNLPNECYVGIELLDKKPFTSLQYQSLARLILDICIRWAIPLWKKDHVLPSPYVLGHEDICPMRRWRILASSGVGYDPGIHFNWDILVEDIISNLDLTTWYNRENLPVG